MKLFIKWIDNTVIDHPVTEDNLRLVYSDFDPTNNNYNYVPFHRSSIPTLDMPYVYLECVYDFRHGEVHEVYTIKAMTAEQKQQYISERPSPFASWVFDEPTATWRPPTPYPQDGQKYVWDESIVEWKILSEYITK